MIRPLPIHVRQTFFALAAPTLTLATVARDGTAGIATVTTTADHGLTTGRTVAVNAVDNTFNALAAVITVTGAKAFTYENAGDDVTAKADAGTVTRSLRLTTTPWRVRHARLYGVSAVASLALPTANGATLLYGWADRDNPASVTMVGLVPVFTPSAPNPVLLSLSSDERCPLIDLQHLHVLPGAEGDGLLVETWE